MKFSIILPIYNVEKYLSACIDSILSQTFQDFELILVDDGSTDQSPLICDNYCKKDARVKVFHKENGGQSEARNYGLKHANGEYIFFIDSDDFLYNDQVLSKIAAKAVNKMDVIAFKFVSWYEDSNTFDTCKFSFSDIPSSLTTPAQIYPILINRDAYYNSAWSKVIRREILTINHIEFEKGLLGEDNDWYYKVLEYITSLSLIDEVLYVYRQRAGSTTKTLKEKNLTDLLYILEKWSNRLEGKPVSGNNSIILSSLAKQFCHAIIIYSKLSNISHLYSHLRKFSFLLRYSENRRVKIFRYLNRLIGIKGIIVLLKAFHKIRK